MTSRLTSLADAPLGLQCGNHVTREIVDIRKQLELFLTLAPEVVISPTCLHKENTKLASLQNDTDRRTPGGPRARLRETDGRRAQSSYQDGYVLVLNRTIRKTADERVLVWNMEHMQTATKPYYLLDFEQESTIGACKTMADRAVGGYSTASLDYVPADAKTGSPPHARFHGSISTKLPPSWRVERTGSS